MWLDLKFNGLGDLDEAPDRISIDLFACYEGIRVTLYARLNLKNLERSVIEAPEGVDLDEAVTKRILRDSWDYYHVNFKDEK